MAGRISDDVRYLRGLVPEAERMPETCARAARYRDAGASGFFVPGVVEPAAIAAIARAVALPLNALAWPGLPAAAELARLGARRLSAGSAITQCVLGRARALASAFLRDGTLDDDGDLIGYDELNALFAGR